MFEIDFYEDQDGRQPVREFILELRSRAHTSKDARIQFTKITAYLRALEEAGTRIGEPEVKHLEGDLWELRPHANRIIFFYWRDNKFILLHHFVKKSQKTPTREIEQARRNMADFLARKGRKK